MEQTQSLRFPSMIKNQGRLKSFLTLLSMLCTALSAQSGNYNSSQIQFYIVTPPPALESCKGFVPVAYSDVRYDPAPSKLPALPRPVQALHPIGDAIIQICVNKKGIPVSAVTVHRIHNINKITEAYCLSQKFKPFKINNQPSDVTFYMIISCRAIDNKGEIIRGSVFGSSSELKLFLADYLLRGEEL